MTGTVLAEWLRSLQDRICASVESLDGSKFREDTWQRKEGGGGRSRVLSGGNVFEKAGVMFSAVHGSAPEFLLREQSSGGPGSVISDPRFFATGVSVVIHPHNPMVPIIHMNIRYFELLSGDSTIVQSWLGGGIDLTPHYVDPEEARMFHSALKKVCDAHNASFYPRFREWADNYFFLPHRNETRGIGGIFFDKLGAGDRPGLERSVVFWKDVGELFAPLYSAIVNRKKDRTFSASEKKWQLLRRGRYVEFNLLYDRGTKFGLESGGRIESILVSLPATAGWEYNFIPQPGTPEANTLEALKKGMDWTA